MQHLPQWCEPVSAKDLEIIAAQLGRTPRSVVGVAARCRCGAPTVIVTPSRLDDGSPFPTTFYLTHPDAVKAASRLEAAGVMESFNERLQNDADFAAAYKAAHADYLACRDEFGKVPEIADFSAGGMPTRIKCLHALVGHALGRGPGVNPVGDAALEMMRVSKVERWSPDTCICGGEVSDKTLTASQIAQKYQKASKNAVKTGDKSKNKDVVVIETPENMPTLAEKSQLVGAIDCGTNTIRLLIAAVVDAPGNTSSADNAEVANSRLKQKKLLDLVRTIEVVRLGQDVDKTGRLSTAALERTFSALERIASYCQKYAVTPENMQMVATSASRDAENRDVFVAGVRERIGIEPAVISGQSEAKLSFTGAVSSLSEQLASLGVTSGVLVVDIGGGSTELALGDLIPDKTGVPTWTLTQSYSMNIGSVRLWERHLTGLEPKNAAEKLRFSEDANAGSALRVGQQSVREDTTAALEEAAKFVDLSRVQVVIGVAGTVTSIVARHLKLDHYDSAAIHGQCMPVKIMQKGCQEVMDATVEQRLAWGFMSPGRAELIGAGALIWDQLLTEFGQRGAAFAGRENNVLVSEHDILDGIALDIAAK